MRFHGKPVKIEPLKNSKTPNIKEKIKKELIIFFDLKIIKVHEIKPKNILIHDTRNKNIESTILAKEGIMSNIHTNPYITVFNGSRYLNYKNSNETSVLKFDKYEFKIKQVNNTTNIRFRHVEERSLKELFIPDEKLNNKVKNEFYSEGHRRLSSPLLLSLKIS